MRLPRAVSCGDPAVLQWEWLSLMLPFGFTFFLIIFFCFVYFACFLYVFQLWSLRAPLNHLYFQSLFSPLLAQSCHRGRFNCLKIKGLCWGVESCGQTSLGLVSVKAFDRHSPEAQLDLAMSLEQGGFLTGVCRAGEEPSASTAPCP